MIAAAVFVRGRIDQGASDSASASGRPTGVLVCTPELRKVCDQLKTANPDLTVRVEDAGTTYAALTSGAALTDATKVDAWLAPQPWPAMVDEARQRAGRDAAFDAPSGVLARSPMVMVVWTDRLVALKGSCPGGAVDWACVGTDAGRAWTDVGGDAAWGAVKPGHPPADKSATGLFTFALATGEKLGRTDYSRNDLSDAAYREWATNLEQNVPTFTPSAGTALDAMLSQGRSSFDVAGAIEATAGPSVAASREKDNLAILYPAPVTTADVVLAPTKGNESGARIKRLLESAPAAAALAQAGWRVPGQPAAAGIDAGQALPDPNPLPRAGVLQAVRETWTEVK